MKVLVDECVPRGVRKSLSEHESLTVPEAGLAGKKNGALLEAAERAGFEVLLTIDQGIPYQQNLASRTIAIIIMRPRSNKLQDVLPLMDECLVAMRSLTAGQLVRIPSVTGR